MSQCKNKPGGEGLPIYALKSKETNNESNLISQFDYFRLVRMMCFPVNFVKFLRAPFLQNTFGRLLSIIKSIVFMREHFGYSTTTSNDHFINF